MIQDLREKHSWPLHKPDLPTQDVGWENLGLELALERTDATSRCIVEIGSLFGSSAKRWARRARNATIICVDPWEDLEDRNIFKRFPETAELLRGRKDGTYQLFLSNCWEFRDRMIPVRGTSPGALVELAVHGVNPDLVYIDGDHSFEAVTVDLIVSRDLFPQSTIAGDDWAWDSVRDAVERFARRHDCSIEHRENSWVLEPGT